MLSSLAGQIHPFSFKPLNVWFAEEIFGLHFGNETDISTFRCRKHQSKWLSALRWNVCAVLENGVRKESKDLLACLCLRWQNQFYNPKLIFVRHTSINVNDMEGMFSFCFSWQSLRQLCLLEKVPLQREVLPFSACSYEQRLVILVRWMVSSPTETVALWGFSMSRVDSGGVSIGLSSSSGAWPSPRDQTDDLTERDSMTQSSRLSPFKEGWSKTVEELLHPPESHTDRHIHVLSFAHQFIQQRNWSSSRHGKHEKSNRKAQKHFQTCVRSSSSWLQNAPIFFVPVFVGN